MSTEPERIRKIFAERQEPGEGAFDAFRLLAHHERQERLLRFFRDAGFASLQDLRILDVGCGAGGHLRRLCDFGARPEDCFGVDLFPRALHDARQLNPNITFAEANATQLPFSDGTFDLAFQYTVLTSVLDENVQRSIVREIWRVLKPGGYCIVYDFAYSNPANANVRGIKRQELARLFEGFRVQSYSITLAPPIGRWAAPLSPALYRLLAAIPLLRTHYLCFARKP
ncbi:MAG TPA: class I SAM-dependent methyltransferase [Candidatus Sulfotelmatobacter sp.]|nr:class I SAM-dependent methyltransferase [Candidatus Sulfotelmatobacter sp.]